MSVHICTRLGLLLGVCALCGCQSFYRIALPLVYETVSLPEAQTFRDLPYREGTDIDTVKHRLNLFLPTGSGWPVVVFVHGGGWNTGDRDEQLGGHDYYNNIGRYLAAHGIGAAVLSYRLLPYVSLPEQLDDVAAATAWVYRHIGQYGGNPQALFLMGYSAGAQLATWVALDPQLLRHYGLPPSAVCGVIPASGAGFDLADPQTYALGTDKDYFRERFGQGRSDGQWEQETSPIRFVRNGAPPFLILYAAGEESGFHRQASVLDSTLRAADVPSRMVVVPARSHARMVLALSRDDREAGPAVRTFVETTSCPPP